MQIEIEKDTSKKVDEASKALRIKKNEFVERAILLYVDNMQKYIGLKEEMKAWDSLSDEALENFEKS